MANKFSSEIGLGLALVALCLSAVSSNAAVAEWKSFDEKTIEADAIVRGQVLATESRLDPDGRWIRTFTTFRVDEVLKGQGASGTVTIVTPGGSVDGIHQRSVGSPELQQGKEQVIFLQSSPDAMQPLYLEQGVYDVERDEDDRALVRPAASNLVLYDDQTGTIVPAEATRDLETFRSAIRTRLDREHQQIARATSIDTKPGLPEESENFFEENGLILVLLALGIAIAFITWMRKQ